MAELDFRSFEDFERCYPELYEELEIKELPFFSKYFNYIWRCPKCGQTWCAAINDRILGENCPHCTDLSKEPKKPIEATWDGDF